MTDTVSRPSVVPAAPQHTDDDNTEERAGVVWVWDREGMWWPSEDLARYSTLAHDRKNRVAYDHALALRAAEIEWLENRLGGSLAPRSKLLADGYELMRQNVRNLEAARRSSRNGWIVAFAIVLAPVLLMGGCAAKQAADVAQETADRQANGVYRCQELIRMIADPDSVKFSPTQGYGTDGIYVKGDMVRTSSEASAEGTYECSDRPVSTGGWMMHVDKLVGE